MMVETMDEKRYRLLLIEDNKLDQMAFTRFVETAKLPYDCTIAGSVSEALKILGCDQFDVIISDYSLGDGTALDILGFATNTPIIVVTAADAEEVVINAWQAGAYNYLPKDFGLDHLKAIPKVIENALKRKKLEDALSRKQQNLETIFDAVPVGMLLVDENLTITRVNVTEQKKAQRELRSVQGRYQMIFENSAVAITMADEDERLVSWNSFTERLLGMTREDLYLRPVRSLYPAGEWQRMRACNIRQTGAQHHFETKMIRKDGSEIDIDISLRVLKNAEEGHTVSIGVIRDIGERKQAEAKQAQLLKDVENINKELCDFASIVSHDLKAPLRGIRALAGWIADDYADKLGQEGTEQMNVLMSRVDRMYELIEGVLEYSSVGHTKEERVQVNLNVLVPEIIDLLVPPEGITIRVENELPTVECERTRVAQVFQNLLSNAIKYMDKPKGQVRVGCVENGDFWEFSVTDNGPGIKEKHFEKVFQIFQTVSSGHDGESTGVGLTVVKKIIELYGGRVWIESEFGEGSTFFFTLPKQKMEVDQTRLEVNLAC